MKDVTVNGDDVTLSFQTASLLVLEGAVIQRATACQRFLFERLPFVPRTIAATPLVHPKSPRHHNSHLDNSVLCRQKENEKEMSGRREKGDNQMCCIPVISPEISTCSSEIHVHRIQF